LEEKNGDKMSKSLNMNYVNCALLVVVLVLVVMCCKNNEAFSPLKRKRDLRRLYKQKAGL